MPPSHQMHRMDRCNGLVLGYECQKQSLKATLSYQLNDVDKHVLVVGKTSDPRTWHGWLEASLSKAESMRRNGWIGNYYPLPRRATCLCMRLPSYLRASSFASPHYLSTLPQAYHRSLHYPPPRKTVYMNSCIPCVHIPFITLESIAGSQSGFVLKPVSLIYTYIAGMGALASTH